MLPEQLGRSLTWDSGKQLSRTTTGPLRGSHRTADAGTPADASLLVTLAGQVVSGGVVGLDGGGRSLVGPWW